LAYGSVIFPEDYGSGGGVTWSAETGHGGGVLHLTASGYIEVDGEIKADGEDASEDGVGGGAGGSVWMKADSFSGKFQLEQKLM
jgi:hypothetical protein